MVLPAAARCLGHVKNLINRLTDSFTNV